MKQYQIEEIKNYDGLITFLDYNAATYKLLTQKRFAPKNKKILVDMGLIVVEKGWRFIEYTLDDNGYVKNTNGKYIDFNALDDTTRTTINDVMHQHKDIVENSKYISDLNKKELLA